MNYVDIMFGVAFIVVGVMGVRASWKLLIFTLKNKPNVTNK